MELRPYPAPFLSLLPQFILNFEVGLLLHIVAPIRRDGAEFRDRTVTIEHPYACHGGKGKKPHVLSPLGSPNRSVEAGCAESLFFLQGSLH